MENNRDLYKKYIYEKIKSEYNKIEEFNNEKDAKKRKIQCQREGYYFAFCVPVGGKWHLYIG